MGSSCNNVCSWTSCSFLYKSSMCELYIWDLYEQCGSCMYKTRVAGRSELQMFSIRYRSAIKHMLMLLGFIKPSGVYVPCCWAHLHCTIQLYWLTAFANKQAPMKYMSFVCYLDVNVWYSPLNFLKLL